ncbi:ribonuclease H-like domain-containing protein [Caldalkalibacillus salinus]|uniref:ribonuclease H-like domain-containing protein n=1 Tax=Caldalkalibacillus salinus TaxID=2803787 RepID=UPI0019213D50|nr:ribonuclease H-like domain-containing protein [Caldalkalibacillus salinus]
MSLKNKLNRYKTHLSHQADEVKDEVAQPNVDPPLEAGHSLPYEHKWRELQARPFHFDGENAVIREVSYPLEHQHGRYRYGQLLDVIEAWNKKRRSHPLSSYQLSPEDLFFFDTETTGLAGGTGTTIFLLGYSRVLDHEMKVKQLFLPGPSAEVAMYQAFLEDIKVMKRLVTYNGKAFDWPQVKTRHTLIRDMLPTLPSFGHFDLLHAARRLWKHDLPSCRLAVVEEEVLNFKRIEDTPGYLAPMLYFDYLEEQDPDIVAGVLKHNEWDVCSLVTLYIHLSQLLLDIQPERAHDKEKFKIASWYETIGEVHIASELYQLLAQREGRWQRPAKHQMALLLKKAKSYTQATCIWEELSHHHDSPSEVEIELAKLYEHQFKDYEKALHYAQKAYEKWQSSPKPRLRMKESDRRDKEAYEKRIGRLQLKLAKLMTTEDTRDTRTRIV